MVSFKTIIKNKTLEEYFKGDDENGKKKIWKTKNRC